MVITLYVDIVLGLHLLNNEIFFWRKGYKAKLGDILKDLKIIV